MGAFIITLRNLCNIDPSRSHFDTVTVKLGFSGVHIISVVYVFLAFYALIFEKVGWAYCFWLMRACVCHAFFMHSVTLDRAC